MWNRKRSLLLSKIFTMLFMVALLGALVAGPWLVKLLTWYSLHAYNGLFPFFLVTIYTGGVFAGALLFSLYFLLNNIEKDDVFTQKNVAHLRRISWCCFAGTIICALSSFYYLPWCVVAIAAAFVGLVVRVVKNIVAQAVALKEESDYTI